MVIEKFRQATINWNQQLNSAVEEGLDESETRKEENKSHLVVVTDVCLPLLSSGESPLSARVLINYELPTKKVGILFINPKFSFFWLKIRLSFSCCNNHVSGNIYKAYNNLLSFRYYLRNKDLCSLTMASYIWNFLLRWDCHKYGCWRRSNDSQKPRRKQRHYHRRDANQCIVQSINEKARILVLYLSLINGALNVLSFCRFLKSYNNAWISYDLKEDTI